MSATMEKIYPVEVTAEPLPVRRMSFNDVEELSDWLASRLSKRSDLATPQAVKTYLRTLINDNDAWFMRSGNAVALARLVRLPLSAPRAEEVFVFFQDGSQTAAADLYIPMSKWAVNLDCFKLEVDIQTDVPRPEIERRLGKLTRRTGGVVFF